MTKITTKTVIKESIQNCSINKGSAKELYEGELRLVVDDLAQRVVKLTKLYNAAQQSYENATNKAIDQELYISDIKALHGLLGKFLSFKGTYTELPTVDKKSHYMPVRVY